MTIKKTVGITLSCTLLWGSVLVGTFNAVPVYGKDCLSERGELSQMKGLMQRTKFLEKVLRKCDTDPVINYYFGWNLERRDRHQEALRYYQITINNDPSFAKAYFGLASAHRSLGNANIAIRYYKKGLKQDPSNRWAQKRLDELIIKNQENIAKAPQPSLPIETDYSKNIALRYGLSLDELKPEPQQVEAVPTVPVEQQQPLSQEYYDNIASRYGIRMDDLKQDQQQMATVKNIAGRYDIQIDEMIQANRQSETSVCTPPPLGSTGNQTDSSQNEYCNTIADRYGIPMEDLRQNQQQMETAKTIAGRYNIAIEDVVPANQPTTPVAAISAEQAAVPAAQQEVSAPFQDDYYNSIAKRYGIHITDLKQAQQQMASLKDVADRYDIALDDLIQANKQLETSPGVSSKIVGMPTRQQQVQAQNEYFRKIADRYGIRLDDLIQSKNQMSTLQDIAKRYSIPLDDLIQSNNPVDQSSGQVVVSAKEQQAIEKNQNKYLGDIAGRYNIELDKLDKLNKKMATIKNVADQYGIELDELIQANRASAPAKLVRGKGYIVQKAQKNQKQYLREIARRYGVQLTKVNQLNKQMTSLSEIAGRYGIKLDDLVQANKESGIFDNEETYVIKDEHIVSQNEYLGNIAKRYGASIEELMKANRHIQNPNWIFPGQVIKIPENE